jgi:hypothetical protein
VRKNNQKSGKFRTGRKAGIWLALCFALGLHAIFLLLPVTGKLALKEELRAPIELQLTTFKAQPPVLPIPAPEPEPPLPEPVPEPVSEPLPEPATNPVERQAEVEPAEALRPPLPTNRVARQPQPDLDKMTAPEKSVLTSTILARQFISEESVTDKLFGRPLVQNSGELQKEFHYPLRPDLLEMLDQPVPDLPFAYTPGLVRFAYDPGIKGDLQRFWDVITPEFGWRTRYGTEVKCALILVIVGCAWK